MVRLDILLKARSNSHSGLPRTVETAYTIIHTSAPKRIDKRGFSTFFDGPQSMSNIYEATTLSPGLSSAASCSFTFSGHDWSWGRWTMYNPGQEIWTVHSPTGLVASAIKSAQNLRTYQINYKKVGKTIPADKPEFYLKQKKNFP